MFVTITLVDQFQKDLRNPVEVVIKDATVDVLGGKVYVRLAELIKEEEEINNFLHRQLELQKRMSKLIESSNSTIPGVAYSFEVCESENGGIDDAYILVDPRALDVEMERWLGDEGVAI